MTDDLKAGETLLRFHENTLWWYITVMGGMTPVSTEGPAGEYPDWLQVIVAAGKAGGHELRPISPPPRVVLWFVIDEEKQLVRFQGVKEYV